MGSIDVNLNVKGGTSKSDTGVNSQDKKNNDGLKAILGTSKKALGALGAIVGGVAIFSKASGQFGAMFKLLEKSFIYTFKPLGDLIARLLKPVLLLLYKWVQEQILKSRVNIAKGGANLSEGLASGDASQIGTGISQIILGILESIPLLGMLATLGESIGTLISTEFIIPFKTWLEDFFNIDDLPGPTDIIGAVIKMVTDLFSGDLTDTIISMVDFAELFATQFTDIVTGLWEQLMEEVLGIDVTEEVELIRKGVKDWGTKLKDFIKDLDLEAVFTTLRTEITEILDAIKEKAGLVQDSIGSLIQTYIVEPFQNLFQRVMDAINDLKPSSLLSKGYNAVTEALGIDDGIVTKDGKVIKINPNDDVFASKNGFAGMGTTVQTMNVNISIQELNSDIQIERLAQKVSEAIGREISYQG